MLAPTSERLHGEGSEAELASASARIYVEWLAELGEGVAGEVAYSAHGTLVLAFSEEEGAQLRGLPGQWLAPAEARRLEPALSERILGAMYLPGDHQVDNRRLFQALLEAVLRAGVQVRAGTTVVGLLVRSGRAAGVAFADGSELEAGAVVNAAGAWAGLLGGEAAQLAPTRPVRGQIVCLRGAPGLLRHVIRSPRGYLVPRASGEVLVGSTTEDTGYDKSVTPAALRRLLRAAQVMVPGLEAASFVEAWAGLRPDTPDHLPILGSTNIENLFVATGHFRNGILLAPITAEILTGWLLRGKPPIAADDLLPERFTQETRR